MLERGSLGHCVHIVTGRSCVTPSTTISSTRSFQKHRWFSILGISGIVLGLLGPHGRPVLRWTRAAAGLAVAAFGLSGLLVAQAE